MADACGESYAGTRTESKEMERGERSIARNISEKKYGGGGILLKW